MELDVWIWQKNLLYVAAPGSFRNSIGRLARLYSVFLRWLFLTERRHDEMPHPISVSRR